ncbi:hypothetical protein C8A05DRAFT_34528, partial [Staphylotrichum tortipilum]
MLAHSLKADAEKHPTAAGARGAARRTPSPSAGPLIFRSPFDVVTEHASAELVEAAPPLPLPAPVPALWDVAVRRFSSPAYN